MMKWVLQFRKELFSHNCNPFAVKRISLVLVLIPYLWAK